MRYHKEYNNGCLANKQTQETAMNHGIKSIALPDLTANLLRDGGCLIDNVFADLWTQLGMKAKLNRLGFHKRSGSPANEVVYALMVWVWLKVDSVGMFARESLKTYSQASKDALYAAMNHEDWNWRRLNLAMALQTASALKASNHPARLRWMIRSRCVLAKRCPAYPVTLTTPRDGASWGSRF